MLRIKPHGPTLTKHYGTAVASNSLADKSELFQSFIKTIWFDARK